MWDYEPFVFMERINAAKQAGVKIQSEIGKLCVARGCAKCISDEDFDVWTELLKSESASPIHYSLHALTECENTDAPMDEEQIAKFQEQLIDTSISAVMWNPDEPGPAQRLLTAVVASGVYASQAAVFKAILHCLMWKELSKSGQPLADTVKARDQFRSSAKLVRQCCNLPLGARVIAEIDGHSTQLKQYAVLERKLGAIKSYATSATVVEMLATSSTSVQPLPRIQSELDSVLAMGGEAFENAFAAEIEIGQSYMESTSWEA